MTWGLYHTKLIWGCTAVFHFPGYLANSAVSRHFSYTYLVPFPKEYFKCESWKRSVTVRRNVSTYNIGHTQCTYSTYKSPKTVHLGPMPIVDAFRPNQKSNIPIVFQWEAEGSRHGLAWSFESMYLEPNALGVTHMARSVCISA